MGSETPAGNAFAHVLINEVLIGHAVRGQRSSRGCGLRFSDGKQEAWNQRKAGILWSLAGLSKGTRWAGGRAGFGGLSLSPGFPTALPEGRESRGAGTLSFVPFSCEIEGSGMGHPPWGVQGPSALQELTLGNVRKGTSGG